MRVEHKEILGLCRTQSFLQYVLIAILSVLLLRGAVQPVADEPSTTASLLDILQAERSALANVQRQCVDLMHLEEAILGLRSCELLASQEKAELNKLLDRIENQLSRNEFSQSEEEGCKLPQEENKVLRQKLAAYKFLKTHAEQQRGELRHSQQENKVLRQHISALKQLQEQHEQEQASTREREADVLQRYEQLKDALHESETFRREENAEWKQKHEDLRVKWFSAKQEPLEAKHEAHAHEAELRAELLRLREDRDAWKKEAQKAQQRLREREEEMKKAHPSWINQVEDFRQRMTEEWQRHAQAHSSPYLGEWLEHARRETEEVAEKLRKKYEKAREKGQKAACRWSRRWGFKNCREDV